MINRDKRGLPPRGMAEERHFFYHRARALARWRAVRTARMRAPCGARRRARGALVGATKQRVAVSIYRLSALSR